MNKMLSFSTVALGVILLQGCGSSTDSPQAASSPSVVKTDVIVTVDGQHHSCSVALSSEAQGSTIACGDVTPFVKDELRVPTGGTYDIRTIPEVDKAELAKVEAGLKDAGYRPAGSRRGASN